MKQASIEPTYLHRCEFANVSRLLDTLVAILRTKKYHGGDVLCSLVAAMASCIEHATGYYAEPGFDAEPVKRLEGVFIDDVIQRLRRRFGEFKPPPPEVRKQLLLFEMRPLSEPGPLSEGGGVSGLLSQLTRALDDTSFYENTEALVLLFQISLAQLTDYQKPDRPGVDKLMAGVRRQLRGNLDLWRRMEPRKTDDQNTRTSLTSPTGRQAPAIHPREK